MSKICVFCQQEMKKMKHHNEDLLDVFMCSDCLEPNYSTFYRQCFYADGDKVLATNFRFNDYFVVINYAFNFTTRRIEYTTIHKNAIGFIANALNIDPVTHDTDRPVLDVPFTIDFPLNNPALLKSKLDLYTLFS